MIAVHQKANYTWDLTPPISYASMMGISRVCQFLVKDWHEQDETLQIGRFLPENRMIMGLIRPN
jgi:hypothetical protein